MIDRVQGSLSFHACPPPGEWLNDPNGLVCRAGLWRLFAQHRRDAPDYRATGWASLSSSNLLDWSFEGAAIPAEKDDWAFSGSVRARGGALEAWHTEHADGLERQIRRRSADDGRSWSAPDAEVGPARRDWRDPFVFFDDGVDYMLVAAPCPWTDDGAGARSRLDVLASRDDGATWGQVGVIGPWSPPRVMWETPCLIRDDDGVWSLFIAQVDRRGGEACSVRRWRGNFQRGAFVRALPDDDDGAPVDCGPDFYAAAPSASSDDGPQGRLILGWASSWATARRFPWPGFSGGPISLPRRVTPKGSTPLPQIVDAFRHPTADVPCAGLGVAMTRGAFDMRIEGAEAALSIVLDPGRGLSVDRSGAGLAWKQDFTIVGGRVDRKLNLFVDGPLIELHVAPDDLWVTAGLPVDGPFRLRMSSGAFNWRVRS